MLILLDLDGTLTDPYDGIRRAHGLRSIGVRWGYAEEGELERAGADVLVSSPTELTGVLLR